MRIQTVHPSAYPLAAPATLPAIGPRGEAGRAAPDSRAPLAAYAVRQPPVDVMQGFSARAQRAIAAYTQNDVLEHRTQYTQLLGVDVYA